MNRLTSTTYPLGDTSKNSYFHYDEAANVTGCANSFPLGRRTRMIDASGTTYYCYECDEEAAGRGEQGDRY